METADAVENYIYEITSWPYYIQTAAVVLGSGWTVSRIEACMNSIIGSMKLDRQFHGCSWFFGQFALPNYLPSSHGSSWATGHIRALGVRWTMLAAPCYSCLFAKLPFVRH